MVFSYAGIDAQGKRAKGKIEAKDLEDAKIRLRSKKILYTKIKEERPSIFSNISFSRAYKIAPKELALLSRDIAMYIKSGISIVNAIRLTKNQYRNHKKIKNFLDNISTHLEEGKNFYQALENQNIIILPNFFKQSIKVSEDSGILDQVLLELSRFLKEQDRINKQIQSAFAYPMFIIVVSVFMVGFMLSFVVPKITSIFSQLDQEIPTITKIVITAGDFFTNNWGVVAGGIVALVVLFATMMKISYGFRYGVHAFMLRIPFFGALLESSELGRFSYISSVLIRSGVPFVQTINLAAKILKNSVIREMFEAASNKVVEGGKLSSALVNAKYKINPSFIQAIALGEETSEVSPILQNLSELYFEENRDKMGIFLSLLEPVLMLVVGGIIGFIVTAMLLPIFSMNIQ